MSSASSGQQHGWRIGTLAGIPVYLGRSWVLVAGLIVLVLGPTVQQIVPDVGVGGYAVAGVFALLLLVSVLVHEAAHAVVAQRVGFTVSRIVADFWGGHTAHDGAGGTPGTSAAVSVVGPLANGVLALLGWSLMGVVEGAVPGLLLIAFTYANAFVAIFNLVPGLPLDGGFLLESLVWKLTGNRHRGTVVAGWTGRAVAVGLVLWVLSPVVLEGRRVGITSVAWAALIGVFLWQGASQAIRGGNLRLAASSRRLGQVARTVGVVPAQAQLSTVDWGSAALWVVEADGRFDGVVDPATLRTVPTDGWAHTSAAAVAVRLPDGWAVPLGPDDAVSEALEVMGRTGSGVIGLLDGQGRPWGVVLVDDVTRS